MNLWSRIKAFRLPRLPLPLDLPPPTSFSEGQRSLFGCLAALAGMAAFVFAVWITRFFMNGDWSAEILPMIVSNLGWALLAALTIMCFVTIGLLVGGPVGRFKGGLGKDGANFEVEDRDTVFTEKTTATTTKTKTVTAPAVGESAAPIEEPFIPGGAP